MFISHILCEFCIIDIIAIIYRNVAFLHIKFGSVNILMELFKKHSIDARYHLCLIIVVELIVATFLGCLEVCLRTLARSL